MRAAWVLMVLLVAPGCFEQDFAAFSCVRGGSFGPAPRNLTRDDAAAIQRDLPAHFQKVVETGADDFKVSGSQGSDLRRGWAVANATGAEGRPWVFDYEGRAVSCWMAVP